MQEFYMDSKVGTIHCCRWVPDGEIKGIIQITHGIQEYAARYDHFASFLAKHGYLVVGADHPGHGQSSSDGKSRGYLAGGWKEAVMVIHRLCRKLREEYPVLPYIMFGHSMGSFLLTTYLTVFHDGITAAVISGTGWQPTGLVSAGCAFCSLEKHRIGDINSSPALIKMMFGPYNKRFEPAKTPYDWICSNEEVVAKYADDPLCTWKPTVQLCSEMLHGIQRNQKQRYLTLMDKDLPVFFIAGQEDPVGDFGNGVLRAAEAFKRAGMKDVLVELYPNMRHECHNEIGKERVYHDVLAWICSKAEAAKGKGCNL